MIEKKLNRTLADAVKTARKEKGWSQAELIIRSGVSNRTLVAIESGEKESPRPDIVVKLARALRANSHEWLELAGRTGFSEEKLENVMRRSQGFRFAGELDPNEYLSNLRQRMSPEKPVVMCVAYPSVPGSLHREDVQRTLVTLLENGLSLAMASPFPRIADIETATRTSLARHYAEVFGQVVELAKVLRAGVSSKKKGRVAVFEPRRHSPTEVQYVMPLAGLSEYRPTLTRYFDDIGGDKSEFELSAWVTLTQEKADRWIRIYPGPDQPERETRFQKLLCWKDYFADILDAAEPKSEDGNTWKDGFEGLDWKKVNSEPGK